MSFTYLASPYTHPDPVVMEHRYREALTCCHWLLIRRIWVYSPIVHCHELAKAHALPRESFFWQDYNEAMLGRAKRLLILTLDGWADSKGIELEVTHADRNHIRIEFISSTLLVNPLGQSRPHYEIRKEKPDVKT